MWKLKKVLKLRLKSNNNNNNYMAEIRTREFDAESMRYLSYLLYPLVIGGAIYSLLYQHHKRYNVKNYNLFYIILQIFIFIFQISVGIHGVLIL